MKVVLVGTGNVAWALGRRMTAAGLEVVQVAGRNLKKTNELAEALGAASVYHFGQIDPTAHLVLLAVADKAIEEVAALLPPVSGVLAHTAGSVSIKILAQFAKSYGVIYPLQSLLKEDPNQGPIPMLVDGCNQKSLATISDIASRISDRVQPCSDEARLHFHLAAVFANNFVNHMLAIAHALCSSQQLDSALLHPLVLETARRATQTNPSRLQTGPALRADSDTLMRHHDLLHRHPAWQNVYDAITQSIQHMHLTGG